jgi:hypothetical protein
MWLPSRIFPGLLAPQAPRRPRTSQYAQVPPRGQEKPGSCPRSRPARSSCLRPLVSDASSCRSQAGDDARPALGSAVAGSYGHAVMAFLRAGESRTHGSRGGPGRKGRRVTEAGPGGKEAGRHASPGPEMAPGCRLRRTTVVAGVAMETGPGVRVSAHVAAPGSASALTGGSARLRGGLLPWR